MLLKKIPNWRYFSNFFLFCLLPNSIQLRDSLAGELYHIDVFFGLFCRLNAPLDCGDSFSRYWPSILKQKSDVNNYGHSGRDWVYGEWCGANSPRIYHRKLRMVPRVSTFSCHCHHIYNCTPLANLFPRSQRNKTN